MLFPCECIKVCERSLSGSGPNTAAPQFIRADMLPSGYLIRPCDGGGSIIHIVDHLNLEVCCVPFSNQIVFCCFEEKLTCINLVGMERARGVTAIIPIIQSCGSENDHSSKFASTFNIIFSGIAILSLTWLFFSYF